MEVHQDGRSQLACMQASISSMVFSIIIHGINIFIMIIITVVNFFCMQASINSMVVDIIIIGIIIIAVVILIFFVVVIIVIVIFAFLILSPSSPHRNSAFPHFYII